jgi:hypothetical protein
VLGRELSRSVSVVSAQEGWAAGRPANMPTDLAPALARKRAAQIHLQTEITVLLFWLIICLGLMFEFLA